MQLGEQIISILASSDKSISGQDLANRFSVSRNAVWKSIRELKRQGYDIQAATNRGYLLSQKNTRLCAQQIKRFAEELDIVLLENVDSTNSAAKQLAINGAAHGTAVIAHSQSSGRGRLGRSFFSPEGGIYLSIILRPRFSPQITTLATAAAAVAAAQSIERTCGRATQIKWVNDIYIDGKKVCGILTEGGFNAELGRLDYAVLGIGINMDTPRGGFPKEISDIAGSLFNQGNTTSIQKSQLIGDFAKTFFGFLENIESRSFMDDYRRRSLLTGKTVEYTAEGVGHSGKVIDIDDNAHLIIQENGRQVTIGAGEVSVKWK